jgi:hypothetical protein
MRCRAGLNADQTRRQLAEQGQHLTTPHLSAYHDRAGLIDAMHLKDILRYIQTDCANLIHGVAPLLRFLVPASWHPEVPVEEPSTASGTDI